MPTPRSYQLTGAGFLQKREGAILADEMGLGKTAQALLAITDDMKARGVLVVCPASLKRNWQKEIALWRPDLAPHTGILSGSNNDRLYPVTIVNYDILKSNHELLKSRKWGVCIADEVHYIKHATSARSKALLSLDIHYRWALSGTPVESRPIEFYPVLWWLRQPIANSKREYGIRYCAGFYDSWSGEWNYRGSSNLEELKRHVDKVMLRRMKDDVAKELPPKVRQIIELEPRSEDRAVIKKEQDLAGFEHTTLEELNWKSLGDLAKLRSALGRAKAGAGARFVTDLLEESEGKVIVFAHHTEVLDTLEEELADHGLVRLDGSTSQALRQKSVDEFQTNPEIRVFLGNIKAAGVGITLTAADKVVFVEYDWTPGVNTQAEDRAHRIGQEKTVNIFYLVVDKTVDAMVAQVLVKKLNVTKVLLAESLHEVEENKKPNKESKTEAMKSKTIAVALLAIAKGLTEAAEAFTQDAAGEEVSAPQPSALAAPVPQNPKTATGEKPKAPKAEKKDKPAPKADEIDDKALLEAAVEHLKRAGKDSAQRITAKFGADKVTAIPQGSRKEAVELFKGGEFGAEA